MIKGSHHSTISKQKMSNAKKGKPVNPPGYKHGSETLKKMSDATKLQMENIERRNKTASIWKGKHLPEELKIKIGLGNKGKTVSAETRLKISNAHKGKKLSDIHKLHLSISHKDMKGDKNPCWRGGISFEPYCPKWTKEFKIRIRAFFDYRCIICGTSEKELKKRLCCHHVEYNKQACCDGKPAHFATLCTKHHAMTNHDRTRWETIIHKIIDEIYNGRSYFTQEEFELTYNKVYIG